MSSIGLLDGDYNGTPLPIIYMATLIADYTGLNNKLLNILVYSLINWTID